MGDTEEGIEAEERSLAVIGAVALAGATGGAALPVLTAVVAGVAADVILTGASSIWLGYVSLSSQVVDPSTQELRVLDIISTIPRP